MWECRQVRWRLNESVRIFEIYSPEIFIYLFIFNKATPEVVLFTFFFALRRNIKNYPEFHKRSVRERQWAGQLCNDRAALLRRTQEETW